VAQLERGGLHISYCKTIVFKFIGRLELGGTMFSASGYSKKMLDGYEKYDKY
jgi:hypothetical protein